MNLYTVYMQKKIFIFEKKNDQYLYPIFLWIAKTHPRELFCFAIFLVDFAKASSFLMVYILLMLS